MLDATLEMVGFNRVLGTRFNDPAELDAIDDDTRRAMQEQVRRLAEKKD